MGANNIIVREYLESLKEDKELDNLFPILLESMGFQIVSTPRNSKGQSQYGKDIIAIGKNVSGEKCRFYFELKGYVDKDIDDTVLSKPDGIIESFRASKLTKYEDASIVGFNQLPIMYVLVHNGILKENTRLTFDGFVKSEFKENEFDRWDIYKLTELFSVHVFNEYLFANDNNLRLFKKVLLLLDVPENDLSNFYTLINVLFANFANKNKRERLHFFATLKLVSHLIYSFAKGNNNLYPAKEFTNYLVLTFWHWILENNKEKSKEILSQFDSILRIQHDIYKDYFDKTIRYAVKDDGLFNELGGMFEEVGYPLRAFDYINDLLCFFELERFFMSKSKKTLKELNILKQTQKDLLIEIIAQNEGCRRPQLDNHSITIIGVILFLIKDRNLYRQIDKEFLANYIITALDNIALIKNSRDRFPELGNNTNYLAEFCSTRNRPYEYSDKSSMLVALLFEFIAHFDFPSLYKLFCDFFMKHDLSLQLPMPLFSEFEIELLMFKNHMSNEYFAETIELNPNFEEFKTDIHNIECESTEFRTDKAGYSFLRILAHIFYKNEFFMFEYRSIFRK